VGFKYPPTYIKKFKISEFKIKMEVRVFDESNSIKKKKKKILLDLTIKGYK